MKKTQIAFFDTKPYDRQFFDIANQKHNFIIHYFESVSTEDRNPLLGWGLTGKQVYVLSHL